VALAQEVGGEIVNVDAFQLYQGLDLLTAKPSAAALQAVAHHLYSVLAASDSCDAQRYRRMALEVIDEIHARGRQAIVVGGSGLYLKALSHGLAELPAGDEELRATLREMPLEEKQRQLLALDPDAAENVPLANPRYVERALEICLLTGQPQSALRRNFAKTQPWGSGIVLQWDRATLHQRIHQRATAMVEGGLLTEVSAFSIGGGALEKAIGLSEMRAHLRGECSLTEAQAAMEQATRRYAKRQGTWFRREGWLKPFPLVADQRVEQCVSAVLELFPHLRG
jgi:tRNA dimethylallyltransferase